MEQKEICGCQWFAGSEIPFDKLFETIALAHIYMENIGPMIMVCNEDGYDFLARNGLEEFYIDVIIVPNETITYQLVNKMIDNHANIENSLQDCSENLRTLFAETEETLGWLRERLQEVVSKEQILRSI
jgi:hypothetical protein